MKREVTLQPDEELEETPKPILKKSLMARLTSQIAPAVKTPEGKPFNEPVDVKHQYYNVLSEITDYKKRIHYEHP